MQAHFTPQKTGRVKIKSFKQENNFLQIELAGINEKDQFMMLQELYGEELIKQSYYHLFFLDHFLALPREYAIEFLNNKSIQNILLKYGLKEEDCNHLKEKIELYLKEKKPIPEKKLALDESSAQKPFFYGKEFKRTDNETKAQLSVAFHEKQKAVHKHIDDQLQYYAEHTRYVIFELDEKFFAEAVTAQYPIEKFAQLIEGQKKQIIIDCHRVLKYAHLPLDYKNSVAKLLLEKLEQCSPDSWCDDRAVIFGNLDQIQKLLEKSRKSGRQCLFEDARRIFRALCQFSCNDSTAIASYLMDKMYNTDICRPAGSENPVTMAASFGQLQLVSLFIDKIMSGNNPLKFLFLGLGEALIQASLYGHLDIVNYLVAKIKEIHYCDRPYSICESYLFSQAFCAAASKGHLEICQQLRKLGAATTIIDRHQMGQDKSFYFDADHFQVSDAHYLAKSSNQPHVVKWLNKTCGITPEQLTIVDILKARTQPIKMEP